MMSEPWEIIIIDNRQVVEVNIDPANTPREFALLWHIAAAFHPPGEPPVQAQALCVVTATGFSWLEGEPDGALAARLDEAWRAYIKVHEREAA
jgi:hypothetical protein